jgi:protein-S-isoprenylcysteine O-methyltransferase Ste14
MSGAGFAMATISGSIIIGCWLIFIVYWLIRARWTKAIAEKESARSALTHRIPLGLSYLLLADGHLPGPLNLSVTPDADWARGMGISVCLLGLFFTLWARWTLAGNWSSNVAFKQGHELIETGPYRFVRHPIYTGILAMCLGTALDSGRLRCWLALLLMTITFGIKLMQEERLMLRHFPDQYPAYRKRVKALVPLII